MNQRRPKSSKQNPRGARSRNPRHRTETPGQLRIVGGEFGGRKITYSGDPKVRPMKDRTRESVFNLLGPAVRGTTVWDLFAGTGAMGIEAISRGSSKATLIERHIGAANVVAGNIKTLGLDDRVRLVRADAFVWVQERTLSAESADLDAPGWLIFCCPPYAFYEERLDDLRQLLQTFRNAAPPKSTIVVEAERPFDFNSIWTDDWSVRDYAPATIGRVRVG